jgi:hypothetical protein
MFRISRCLKASLVILTMGLVPLAVDVAFGQRADTSSGLSQSRRGDAREPGDASKASVVHVGAGTTNASTTGYSGPSKPSPPHPPGEIRVPPLPSAALCDGFRDTGGYDTCLQVVTRQDGGSR